MNTFFTPKGSERMGKVLLLGALFLTLFLCMKFIGETKKLVNSDVDLSKVSTIDVSGEGYVFAVPDVATESFTVEQKGATVHEAQAVVTKKVNDAVAFLKDSGIAEKDIKTTNYSANPEYSYSNPCADKICTQVYSAPKIIGYTVSETITVKIHDTTLVGKIVDGLGARGVTGLNGPDFTVDDSDAVMAEARGKAIADAKEKANILAKQLGVRLVQIVRFSENNGGGYPMPMYKAMDMAEGATASSAPAMPAGQNKYTSNVTITYEIQ